MTGILAVQRGSVHSAVRGHRIWWAVGKSFLARHASQGDLFATGKNKIAALSALQLAADRRRRKYRCGGGAVGAGFSVGGGTDAPTHAIDGALWLRISAFAYNDPDDFARLAELVTRVIREAAL